MPPPTKLNGTSPASTTAGPNVLSPPPASATPPPTTPPPPSSSTAGNPSSASPKSAAPPPPPQPPNTAKTCSANVPTISKKRAGHALAASLVTKMGIPTTTASQARRAQATTTARNSTPAKRTASRKTAPVWRSCMGLIGRCSISI